jgi:predicted MPP superfamily phosphohydrolase
VDIETLVMSITIGLAAFLIVVLIIFFTKKFKHKDANSKLKKALEKKGISVVDVKNQKESKQVSEGDVDEIVLHLNAVLDQEKELKKEERVITKKIEDLYNKTRSLRGEDSEPEKPKAGLDDDTKKVLRKVDDLLEKLPQDVIDEFVKSEEFELYKKIIKKAKE